MSSSTTSDIVPYVAHNVFETIDIYEAGTFDPITKICAPYDFTDGTISLEVNGWKLDYGDEGFHMIGKRSRIYAYKWMKDSKVVYTINESKYEGDGPCELAVVADNEDAINEFCNDNSFVVRFGIDETDSVQQTM